MRALLDAVMAISSDLDLHHVLGRTVESAATLTGARYGALGMLGPEEYLVGFLTTGMSDEELAVGLAGQAPRRSAARATV